MSPETCQKRYSFQRPYQHNNPRPSHRENLIAKITKSQSIKRAIEPSKWHKALQFSRNRRGQSPTAKPVWKAKTKSGAINHHLNQCSSHDHQISNQKPLSGTAPLDAPINVPSHRTFNLWSRILFINDRDSKATQQATQQSYFHRNQ